MIEQCIKLAKNRLGSSMRQYCILHIEQQLLYSLVGSAASQWISRFVHDSVKLHAAKASIEQSGGFADLSALETVLYSTWLTDPSALPCSYRILTCQLHTVTIICYRLCWTPEYIWLGQCHVGGSSSQEAASVYDTVKRARNYVVINPRVFAETVTWTQGLRDKLRRRQKHPQ